MMVRGVNLEPRPVLTDRARIAPGTAEHERRALADSPHGPALDSLRSSPFGFVLIDGGGRVLSVNERAAAVLSAAGRDPERPDMTCCELICGPVNGRSGSVDGACLTRRALSLGRALPETRLELRRNGASSDVWVTASPIEVADARVIVYLRREEPRERRRKGDERTGVLREAPALRVHTLGATRVEVGETDLGGEWLDQRPGQLLKYLICERHRLVTCDEIGEALWTQAGPLTRNSVRHQVHVLRERLEPDRVSRSASRFIATRRGGYMLNPDEVWLDADQFELEIRAGLRHYARGSSTAAAHRLERALALYRGDLFAENLYAEWALEERDRLRDLAGQGLRAMVAIARSAGDLDTAASHARRLAAMEPFDMDVQREFIEICMSRGRRSEAMRRYAIVRKRVRREFGQDVGFTLGDLRA